MNELVLRHFDTCDPILAKVARLHAHKHLGPRKNQDAFASLARTIVGQQLSGKAANSIWQKLSGLFPKKLVTVKRVQNMPPEKMRSAGLSFAKVRSLKALADSRIDFKNLFTKNELDIRDVLISVKGIGPWTIEMFLMFSLGHEDIFSPGDLGLRKGMQRLYRMRALPTPELASRKAKKWSPYRTYASCVLWECVDSEDWFEN